ncbi:MAG: hypothetical protein ABI429_08305 [Jatrophihabitantaceae bacterium]
MTDTATPEPERRSKDGRTWPMGTAADVAWIARGTTLDRTITSGIPSVFVAYATVVVPDEVADRVAQDRALLALLRAHTADQPWWLGFLDTGAEDVVFPDVAMVTLYAGWRYVLVAAGPEQAATLKDPSSWRGGLPDVIFPADRSWLVSTLWDDDWRCVGGPAPLINALLDEHSLQTRAVALGEDATPAGHTSF